MLLTLYGDYIRYVGGEIWTGSLLRLMSGFDFSDQAVRAALSRLSRQGWLSRRKVGNRSYYAVTPRAAERLEEAGRRIYQAGPGAWDGQWRILTYTIPEARREVRDALRKELAWTGFGQLASSVWVSPGDLTGPALHLIDRYGLRDRVDLFTARYQGPGRNEDLVAKGWNLPALRVHYDAFVAACRPRLPEGPAPAELADQAAGPGGLPDNRGRTFRRAFVERTRLVHEYRKFLFDDPGLPAELLPADWPASAAARLFRDLDRLLAPGAAGRSGPDRFFASVFVPAPDRAVPRPPDRSSERDPFAALTIGRSTI